MDWLCPLRRGDNPELRIALRSWVANAGMGEGDRLVTVGDHPAWLEPDLHIPANLHRSGPLNVYDNLRTACLSGELSADAIVTNDDFFALEPVDPTVVYYRDTLAAHIKRLQRNTWWCSSLIHTLVYLRSHGVQHPLSYELHRPLPIDTELMGSVLSDAWADGSKGFPPQWRTLYANLAGVPDPVQTKDCKVLSRRGEPAGPWFSTTDGSWKLGWGERLSAMFTEPSPWETDQ